MARAETSPLSRSLYVVSDGVLSGSAVFTVLLALWNASRALKERAASDPSKQEAVDTLLAVLHSAVAKFAERHIWCCC